MTQKPTIVKFFAPVVDITINALMNAIDQKMIQGQKDFILLISSPGGSVFHGLSAYITGSRIYLAFRPPHTGLNLYENNG